MSSMKCAALPLLLIAILALPLTAAQSVNPRAKPEALVVEGIRLLEGKDYVAFFKAFVPPDDLKRVTEGSSIEEFAKRFGPDRGPIMLSLLKSASATKPTIEADGKTAVFTLKEPVMGKGSLTFIKVGEFWYLQS